MDDDADAVEPRAQGRRVVETEDAERFCLALQAGFSAVVRSAYSPEDLARGAIDVIDRGGVPRTTPLIGLSIAVVLQQTGRYSHVGELARAAAEIKGYLKQHGGGYLIEFPDLPGCMSDGETIEEAIAHGLDAMRGWIEAMRAEGHPIPKPTRSAAA